MSSTTKDEYAVLQKGALKEEVWTWEDLERMARAGQFSPESLIFVAEENTWKKAGDTELSVCFENSDPELAANDSGRDLEAEYEEALTEIRENPTDQDPILNAAEIALAMNNRDAARDHYQHALEMTPYHPRVAREAKRNLPAAQWRTLRFLEKPPHIWEEPLSLGAYPAARGPLYIIVPAAVCFVSSWSVLTTAAAGLVLGLWLMEIIAVSSRGRAKPPSWRALVSGSAKTILKRAVVLTGAVLEVSLPFAAIAVVLTATGQSHRGGVIETIAGSPVLSVLIFTVSLCYLPVVISLVSASPSARLRDMMNPKCIASAIRVMEGEYIVTIGFILLLLCVMWGVGELAGSIPLARRILYAASAAYIIPAAGLVLGRLHSRFKERLEEPEHRSTGA